MTDFSDLSVAASVRDTIKQIAMDVVRQEAPKPQFGRVISVNFVSMTATVWFPGDPMPVSVNLFSSVLPGQWQEKYVTDSSGYPNTSLIGTGSRVAVETLNGSQYITQVLNGGQFSVDFNSAGYQQSPFGIRGIPEDPSSGDFVFHVNWDTYGSPPIAPLPKNGGPYAINIGPFSAEMNNAASNSSNEIEIIGFNGQTQRYEFNTYPYYAIAKTETANVYDSGRWIRLIPTVTDAIDGNSEDRSSALNKVGYFTPPGGTADSIQDWTGGTGTNVAYSSNFSGSMRVWSQNGTTTPLEVLTDTSKKYQVRGGTRYYAQADVRSDFAWASGFRLAINWYTSAGALISTSNGPASAAIVANAVPLGINTYFTAPVNAAYAVWKLNVLGTPPTSQSFYFNGIQFCSDDPANKNDYSLDFTLRKTIHGSSNDLPSNSYGEFWIRIYIHWLNNAQDPHWTVRVKNTAGWTTYKSRKTGKPVYEFVTNPVDAQAYYGYHDSNVGYTANPSSYTSVSTGMWSQGPWRNSDLTLAYRAQEVLSGGGVITWDGSKFKWTKPFEIGGIGRSRHGLMVGSAGISMPTTGQVPVFPGGPSSAFLDGSGIPLAPGQSLWFGIPPGLASSTIPNSAYYGGGIHGAGGLFIVDSSSLTIWSPPEWAVMLAYRLTDASQPEIKCGNGQTIDTWRTPTLQNGWLPYDTGTQFNQPGYTMLNDGLVALKGLMKSGTISTSLPMFTLPVGWRPLRDNIFPTATSGEVFAECRVTSSGLVLPYTGNNTWYALDGIRFRAEQ